MNNNPPIILYTLLLIHLLLHPSREQNLNYNSTTADLSRVEQDGRSFQGYSPEYNGISDFETWQPSGKLMADSSDEIYHKYGDYDSLGHEDYYHHHHPWEHTSIKPFMQMPEKSHKLSDLFSVNFLKIALIALLKILFVKLQTIGFLKIGLILLLKIPLFLIGTLFKVIFLAKALNFLKILTIPLFLPLILLLLGPLLPFLLIPLAPALLIPFLLPLLLFLPIPVLTLTTSTTTTTTTPRPTAGGRRRRRRRGINETEDFRSIDIQMFRYIIESEKCLERIACKLASDKQSAPFSHYIGGIFDTLKKYLTNPRFVSYVQSYKFGATMKRNQASCNNFYPCSAFKM